VLLIGGGEDAYTRTLRDRAASLGLGERAIFAGWAQGDDKWLALAAGDVLTLNSVHENFGFVAVEALCVGTMPVLTSNLAIAAEMKAGRVAEVAEPDAGALAAAWARAIEGNGGIGGLAVMGRGREWVRANLSVEAIGEKLETLYSSVTATRGRG
jgi:glycosyltransferase involved in cell wall biosynthesis